MYCLRLVLYYFLLNVYSSGVVVTVKFWFNYSSANQFHLRAIRQQVEQTLPISHPRVSDHPQGRGHSPSHAWSDRLESLQHAIKIIERN